MLASIDELEGVAPTAETIVDVTGPLLPPVITVTLVTVSCAAPPVGDTVVRIVLVGVMVPLLLEDEDVRLKTIVPLRFGTSLVLPLVSSVVVALNVLVTLGAVPALAAVRSVELHIIEPTCTVLVDNLLGFPNEKGRPPIPVRLPFR